MRVLTTNNNDFSDHSQNLTCPHCSNGTSPVLTSPPKYHPLMKHKPKLVGVGYLCTSCNEPIVLKYAIEEFTDSYIAFQKDFQEVEKPTTKFEFEYIPDDVKADFKEALACYSIQAYNAFAAMTRRTIQSVANELGAEGKTKVQLQLKEMKDIADIDDETFDILKQMMIDGHDGAHPHLPELSAERAAILLSMLKDMMQQIYVRRGKLKKAAELRQEQINTKKTVGTS